MKHILVATFFSLFLYQSAFSQGSFSVHLGPSFPTADFADDDVDSYDDNNTGASLGLSAGVQYVHPLNENGLGFLAGLDIIYNGLKNNLKDDWEDYYSNLDSHYSFLNIPITAGVNYRLDSKSNENLSFIGNAGLIFNFLKITNQEFEDGDFYEFDLSNKIGIRLGAGVLLNDEISIELNYFAPGEHDIDYRYIDTDGDAYDTQDSDKQVSIVTLTVGLKLK